VSPERRQRSRLERLVSLETPSGDAARLQQGYDALAPWVAEALGRPAAVVVAEGVPHLVAVPEGPDPVLVLCHLDTVFPAGTIAERPFRVEDGRALGPGVFDMKAGIVAALEGIGGLPGHIDRSRIGVLVTGDEETGSGTSRPLIEEVAAEVTAVLIPEPSLDGALKIGRKGGAFYDMTFRGVAAHAGLEPERGRNALLELARWALSVGDLADDERGTSVTPTRASAGTALNVVPDRAVLTVDVRAATLAELERVDGAIAAEAATEVNGVAVEVAGGINRPPLEQEASVGLADLCREQARRLGLADPGVVTVGGGSDGNFTAAMGIPTLDGLGPRGDGAHAAHEWVDLASLGERAQLLTALLGAVLDGGPAV
jgi:glutamate carboxypeptidase